MTDLYRILVVCTGNVCRSPMAEGLLALHVKDAHLDHVVVESGGTHAPEGSAASTFARAAASELGANIQGHRARYLNRAMVKDADLILVMEQAHQYFILSALPEEAEGKVRMIRAFDCNAPSEKDVPDPIGADLGYYRDIARMIDDCCKGVVNYLKKTGRGD
ncbi:MAG: low molecular weight protein-tyrosine-phosphatase [Planctomycetota bacterium]